MKPYTPQPGTIPHHVVEHLKTLPPGTELSTAVLADTIGQPRGILAACLNVPRKHGVLAARKEGGLMLWSLGSNQPECPPADHEPDEPLHPVPKVPKKPPSPFDLRQPRALKPRQAGPVIEPTPAPAPEPSIALPVVRIIPTAHPGASTRFGSFSDGTMTIEKLGTRINLTAEETENLSKFIAKSRTQ